MTDKLKTDAIEQLFKDYEDMFTVDGKQVNCEEIYLLNKAKPQLTALTTTIAALRGCLEKHIHLHMAEQEGIQSGQPTPEQWWELVEETERLLASPPQKEAEQCPECLGYGYFEKDNSQASEKVKCKACNGSGHLK